MDRRLVMMAVVAVVVHPVLVLVLLVLVLLVLLRRVVVVVVRMRERCDSHRAERSEIGVAGVELGASGRNGFGVRCGCRRR